VSPRNRILGYVRGAMSARPRTPHPGRFDGRYLTGDDRAPVERFSELFSASGGEVERFDDLEAAASWLAAFQRDFESATVGRRSRAFSGRACLRAVPTSPRWRYPPRSAPWPRRGRSYSTPATGGGPSSSHRPTWCSSGSRTSTARSSPRWSRSNPTCRRRSDSIRVLRSPRISGRFSCAACTGRAASWPRSSSTRIGSERIRAEGFVVGPGAPRPARGAIGPAGCP
jgi:hypothetical protein